MKCPYCGYDNIRISKCDNNKCFQCGAPLVCNTKDIKLNELNGLKLSPTKNSIKG